MRLPKSDKIIIACALTGAGTSKEKAPSLPVTPDEIAKQAVEVAQAGASMVHIHVRDKDLNGTMDTDIFAEAFEKTKAACQAAGVDVIINLTSSGGLAPTELRLAHLRRLRPEMCSYDAGSMNWNCNYVFDNTPDFLEKLSKTCLEMDIKPEIEIFDPGMLGNAKEYIRRGLLKTPCHFQFVLGVLGGTDGELDSIDYLISHLPEGSTWSITGIGRYHLPCLLAGLAAGADGIRVGLEDNIMFAKGQVANNVQLVERAVALSKLANRTPATAAEARELLGITRSSF